MQENSTKPEIYSDAEVREAIKELFSYQDFLDGMKALVPIQLNKLILEEKDQVTSAHDFQKRVITPFLKTVEQSSISSLTYSGLENLSSNESYLFISNHRDIVLDSAYLNLVLLENGMQTSQVAIGDNLVANRLTELVFKINKSFVVKRTGNPRELYNYANLLSDYIYQTINKKRDSIWIAQREGRSKDGNDRTQISLLKMLSLCHQNDLKTHFQKLKIVPVSISYEFDPCGVLKAQEFIQKKLDSNYKKSFKEDAAHLLLGITGHKGKVHFHFTKPLGEELEPISVMPNDKEVLQFLATTIDKSIHLNYKQNPINYYAYDKLKGGTEHLAMYKNDKIALDVFFDSALMLLPIEFQREGEQFLLKMYANPLINLKTYTF